MHFINKYKLLLFTVFIFSTLFFCACTESKGVKKTEYVDLMKSDVITDEALVKSWGLLEQGQQMADDGKSIDDVLNIFPEGTLLKTNYNSIIFFIQGSVAMSIDFPNIHNNADNEKKILGNFNKTSKSQTLPKLNIKATTLNLPSITSNNLVDVIGNKENDNKRQNKKALLLNPVHKQFEGYKLGIEIANEYLKKNRNYKDHITFLKDSLTIEDFQNFGDYDLIHLTTHGSPYCNLKKVILKDKLTHQNDYSEQNIECEVYISVKIVHNFNTKNLFLFNEFIEKYDDEIIIGLNKIKIKPEFLVNTYKNGLENKIWIFTVCQLGMNSNFATAMNRVHTNGHVFYWDNSVYSIDAYHALSEFYKNLIFKGLDAEKSFEEIPLNLRENLEAIVGYKFKDTIIKNKALAKLIHLQTGDPRHAIEVIDMLNPNNETLVEGNDYYPLVGDFDDGIDEILTLKVKLIGYTQAEFLEKQMRLSLEVDDENVLSKKKFLPDVGRDNITVEPLKNHEFGVIVTINDIAIPDVGTKEDITLKAILHLNDKHISIHKETVSILSYGIIATTEKGGRKSKFTYDGKRKTGKYELGSLPVVYHDNDGYKYVNSNSSGWKKVNMRKMSGTNSNLNERTRTILNFPLAGYALIFKMSDIQKASAYNETKVDCGFPAKCTEFNASTGVKLLYDPSGRLIEFTTPSRTINFKYGNYNVILPEAGIPKKVKELENVMSNLE